jgi:CheY-like chemotaxis protein
MGFSELMKNNFNNKEKLEKFSSIISRRSNDLLDIINDIIDISKIESGQLPVNVDLCDIHSLFVELVSIISDYQINAGKQQLIIETDIPTGLVPRIIKIDKGKLKQIFVNLLTNAVKYTASGSIRFGVNCEDQGLVFYVTDTGDGIPADKQEVVFNRFVRLQNARASNIGGTGLGLSITKGLVTLLGGKIWVESEPGKGSKFSFTVAYTSSDASALQIQKKKSETPVTSLNINILIVEDDQWNAEYLKEVLWAITHNLIVVATGKDAIEAVRKGTVDLILMDVRLPDMTGYEVVEEIRKIKPDVKTIIQTAYASHDERAKALEAGCIDYLSKPVKNEQLIEMLISHFN